MCITFSHCSAYRFVISIQFSVHMTFFIAFIFLEYIVHNLIIIYGDIFIFMGSRMKLMSPIGL